MEKKLLAIKSIVRYVCYQDIFILEGKFLACENSRFSSLYAAPRRGARGNGCFRRQGNL